MNMNLLITIDENYIEPFKVMLCSLYTSESDLKDASIYLLHSNISEEKLCELSRYCGIYSAKLFPIAVDSELFTSAPTTKRYPKEMYYRLLAPLILPSELDRILYLDPDMLIINPITPLYSTELSGKAFAAASHTGLTDVTNEINYARLNIENDYFNSGVLLIDLERAREIVSAEEVFDCVSRYEKKLILPDQDVFNILYGKETLALDDVVWNYDIRNYSKYVIRSTGRYDLEWVMENTAILHFCGKNKPWNDDCKNPFGMLYRHYMSLTKRRDGMVK